MANSYSQSYGSLSVNYNGPVEVGVPTWFTFKFNPLNNLPPGATHYIIENWSIDARNIAGVDIPGYIESPGLLQYVDNDFTYGLDDEIQLPIQVGGSNNVYENNEETIDISVLVYYKDDNNNVIDGGYVNLYNYAIQINRIQPPAISGTTVLLDCSNDEFKLSASAGSANRFDWSIIPGSGSANIIAGNGSDTVTIKPGYTGEFDVKVVARRTQASSNYHKETTIHISRKARTIDYRVLPETANNGYTYIPDYICKGTGRDVTIPEDNDYTNIVWNAPNCTVNYLGHLHGKRLYEIIPNNSIPTGSSIDISITAYFNGGCDATSPIKTFKIFDSEIPPTPDGYVYMTPISGDICQPDGFEVHYSTSYNNGRTSISPPILPPHAHYGTYRIKVVYYNYCSDTSSYKYFYVSPPPPCDDDEDPIHGGRSKQQFTISPNPSKGNFKIKFTEPTTGEYFVYDLYGQIITHDRFNKTKNIKLNIKSDTEQNIIFIYTDKGVSKQQLLITK